MPKLFAQAEVSGLPAARLGMEDGEGDWRKVWVVNRMGQPQSRLNCERGLRGWLSG